MKMVDVAGKHAIAKQCAVFLVLVHGVTQLAVEIIVDVPILVKLEWYVYPICDTHPYK
tara:strand:- start:391 stop:564 length:174 start_codon:yes stop_codon:yes gene_type:complete